MSVRRVELINTNNVRATLRQLIRRRAAHRAQTDHQDVRMERFRIGHGQLVLLTEIRYQLCNDSAVLLGRRWYFMCKSIFCINELPPILSGRFRQKLLDILCRKTPRKRCNKSFAIAKNFRI